MKDKQWYISQNLKPLGPFSLEEMRLRIHKGEVTPQDLILNEADGQWRQAQVWSCFERTLFPAGQERVLEMNLGEKEWIVLVPQEGQKNLRQEGPYSINDIKSSMQAGILLPQQYVWKAGLSGWCRLQDRPEFN